MEPVSYWQSYPPRVEEEVNILDTVMQHCLKKTKNKKKTKQTKNLELKDPTQKAVPQEYLSALDSGADGTETMSKDATARAWILEETIENLHIT